ncbi:MAG: ADP-ribosylglycohydrolase family protein, partial [Phycisphaeraceae bacterium]
MVKRRDQILGCVLGTAIGDAIGLPREGLSPRRAEQMCGGPPLEHTFIVGRGMCSDDTEHTADADVVLVATGRRPYTDGLGLDALGV